LDIATDLSAKLAEGHRYRRFVDAVRRMVPCDATALLLLDGEDLVPLATHGLREDTLGHRFVPAEHPRLARILASPTPVRFTGSALPDPFDGFIAADPSAKLPVHACMGCRLELEGRVVGAITMDSLELGAFDDVRDEDVAALAALAAAALHTARLITALEESCRRSGLMVDQLQSELHGRFGKLVGGSPAMMALRHDIELSAASPLTVLITGETGVGKELVARALHRASSRADLPLVHVNCAALPPGLAESELFGHVRGAFTGAHSERPGRFEAADGGTLFLDEVGELPLSLQPKLLRVLQEGELQRVGSDRVVRVDVRVLAATNRNLEEEVEAGRFRRDLFHRLSVFPIQVPPLRERREDIPTLAGTFLDETRARLGLGPTRLTDAALDALRRYDWPGNVRELKHLLMRAALRAADGSRHDAVVVDVEHLGLAQQPCDSAERGLVERLLPRVGLEREGMTLAEATDAFRRRVVADAVERAGGNWAAAARDLGMNRGNLHRLAKRLGLLEPTRPGGRPGAAAAARGEQNGKVLPLRKKKR